MTMKQKVLAAGGGVIAAVAIVGGVAMAQTPGGATPTPAPEATTAPAQPGTPGSGDRRDCPDKGSGSGGAGARGTQGGGRSAAPQF